jgi:molecular chaperone GrpE
MTDTPVPDSELEAPGPGPVPGDASADGASPPGSAAAVEAATTDDAVVEDAVESAVTDEEAQEEIEISELEGKLLDDIDRLQSERNDYLDQLLRTRADFENYRKRILKQQADHVERAAESLVEKLLDVLDTFELAVAHDQGYEQVHDKLVSVLGKEGLERIDPTGAEFDPNEADAVAHEDGDDGPVVAEVLRPGYRWKGRVLRPAMVKVRG